MHVHLGVFSYIVKIHPSYMSCGNDVSFPYSLLMLQNDTKNMSKGVG